MSNKRKQRETWLEKSGKANSMQDRSAETWMSGPTEETGRDKPASKRQNSEEPCLKLWTARNMNPGHLELT